WPDPHTGESIRVEHWVVAERQGQTAALNLMGVGEKVTAPPVFWSQHYDIPINYVGHAEKWDEIAVARDIAAKHGPMQFQRGQRRARRRSGLPRRGKSRGGGRHGARGRALVSRFRRSYHLAARALTNVGSKGTLATL